jgi:hypothetical protein
MEEMLGRPGRAPAQIFAVDFKQLRAAPVTSPVGAGTEALRMLGRPARGPAALWHLNQGGWPATVGPTEDTGESL